MYKIAIVEDEIQYQKMFESYINKYSKEKGEPISISIFNDGLEITENYEPSWDAILLDIRMKNQDGMSAAHVIREHDKDVAIMFITTLAQYAINGYEVGALDYVLKPVEYDKFAMRFERLLGSIKKDDREYMML
ncbi:MAG: response regulator, partial [Butyrivibrio sp.]|nr:response regulator [Butyrivibrio sp.]